MGLDCSSLGREYLLACCPHADPRNRESLSVPPCFEVLIRDPASGRLQLMEKQRPTALLHRLEGTGFTGGSGELAAFLPSVPTN